MQDSPLPPPVVEKASVVKKSFLADFFDLAHINDTFRVAFKHGKQNRRAKVIMLMLVVMIVSGPWYGECYGRRDSLTNFQPKTASNGSRNDAIFDSGKTIRKCISSRQKLSSIFIDSTFFFRKVANLWQCMIVLQCDLGCRCATLANEHDVMLFTCLYNIYRSSFSSFRRTSGCLSLHSAAIQLERNRIQYFFNFRSYDQYDW